MNRKRIYPILFELHQADNGSKDNLKNKNTTIEEQKGKRYSDKWIAVVGIKYHMLKGVIKALLFSYKYIFNYKIENEYREMYK